MVIYACKFYHDEKGLIDQTQDCRDCMLPCADIEQRIFACP